MSVLLGAFATQAGMDVRPVLVANKDSEVVLDPRSLPEKYFLDDMDIGVKSGDSWKLFSVSNKYLAPALIPSGQEGTFAVVSDPKAAIFMRVQISPPELSMEKRSAKLKLTADGTLIGDVDESYSGYRAETYRSRFARQSAAQREESVRDRVVRMFPSAEMTDLKIENIEDAAKPIRIVYHLEAPLFAQVTGKRILFHPNAFRRAQSTPFTASERRYPVEFPNAWKELDELSIDLPSGFVLESPENPGSFDFGEPGSYKLTMNVKNGDNAQLSVARELTFGAKGRLLFDVSVYPTLKKIFDEIQLRDTHTLSLRGN